MGSRNHGTMMIVCAGRGFRVRIVVDNGLVAESNRVFDTIEQAKAWGNEWCEENNIRTEALQ